MENFDYSAVPFNYVHCLNNDCPQAAHCLRHIAVLHIPAEVKTVNVLNPYFRPAPDVGCPHYRPAEQVSFARGISRLYDDIPLKTAKAVKETLITHFTHSGYYRIYRKEKLIAPKDHAYIARTFQKFGLAFEPCYDGFVDGYEW